MARLIEIEDPQAGPVVMRVQSGDMIIVAATGGHVRDGTAAVEFVGAFLPGVATESGAVIAPAGPPSRVVLRALRPGRADVEVNAGDPFRGPAWRVRMVIEVEP